MDSLQDQLLPIFFQLPAELLFQIIDYLPQHDLPQRDLNNWSLTCRHFTEKLRPILYRFDVAGNHPYQQPRWGNHKGLAWACTHGFMGTLQMAFSSGADLNHRFNHASGLPTELIGMPPLHLALMHRHEDVAQNLVELGADVSITNTFYFGEIYSAMHYATSAAMVRCLHNAGWDAALSDDLFQKKPIIWWMVEAGVEVDVVQAALDVGVLADNNGASSSLLHACARHRLDIVQLLLSRATQWIGQRKKIEPGSWMIRSWNDPVAKGWSGDWTGGWAFKTLKTRDPTEFLRASYRLDGTHEQHCIIETLRCQVDELNAPIMTELVRLLLDRHVASGKGHVGTEITCLVLATNPRIPAAVRSLLLWGSTAAPQSHNRRSLAQLVEKAGHLVDMQGLRDGSLFSRQALVILESVKNSLEFGECFSWSMVQPVIKKMVQMCYSGDELLEIVCTYPNPFTHPHLTDQDEALTLEVIEILLQNRADPRTRIGDQYFGSSVLAWSASIAAVGRVRLLLKQGVIDFRNEALGDAYWLETGHMDEQLANRIHTAQKEVVRELERGPWPRGMVIAEFN
ncbi:hypothetical protein F4779DRAFT_634712 [Xylariaceae sp. FL0662B]|nr:hypothetical protein F4779DRAFT_634712 [Xylariaceae sp. FL0662B]